MGAEFIIAALISGALIGGILALIGGGGSILAVPLVIYVVGVQSTHHAIGTAAVAVAINALVGLLGHARKGTVKWPCSLVFAAAGVIGAILGAELGKSLDGARLLFLFGFVMIAVGFSMMRRSRAIEDPDVELTRESAPRLLVRLLPIGLAVGFAAGLFGIGGGFLIVPGLILATRMPMLNAVGTSLVVVTALGLATATSYAFSGLVDWPLTALLVAGGVIGATGGIFLARLLSDKRDLLKKLFGAFVIGVGAWVSISA